MTSDEGLNGNYAVSSPLIIRDSSPRKRPRLEAVALACPAKRGGPHIRRPRWGRSDCNSSHPQPIVFSPVARTFTQPRRGDRSIFTQPRRGDPSIFTQPRRGDPSTFTQPRRGDRSIFTQPRRGDRSQQPRAQALGPGDRKKEPCRGDAAHPLILCRPVRAHPLDSGPIPGLAAWAVNCSRPCGASSNPRLAGTAEPASVARPVAVGSARTKRGLFLCRDTRPGWRSESQRRLSWDAGRPSDRKSSPCRPRACW